MDKEFIKKQLIFICTLLKDNDIDFHLAGALGGYIDAGLDISRKHDDIDILIEDKYIDTLKDIFDNTEYRFIDNRYTTKSILNEYGYPEGEEHDLYAQHNTLNFHIGFFTYRMDENTYSFIDYFNDNNKIKRLIRTIPNNFFNYQYNDTYINYNGIDIKCVRKELIYKNKSVMNREKDIYDRTSLEPYLDKNILDALSQIKNYRTTSIEDI